MNEKVKVLIEKLAAEHSLSIAEYEYLLTNITDEDKILLREKAQAVRHGQYGKDVYIRGLIEIGNICRNNCFYCGIRAGNTECSRYRLSEEEILSCCESGYGAGFRTFVLQGGEDPFFNDDFLVPLIRKIKDKYSDCAVTLSLGERSSESYKKLFAAGADRYLLRHETADKAHYEKLHPSDMSFDNRMKCLDELKKIGFQVGCGFMVGSPYQTVSALAKDLKFIEEFQPDMCGVGPFIPHKKTPFASFPQGTVELTCTLLSIIRLICPHVLLPATTALGTIDPHGREKGIMSGANVIMPNLSPESARAKYELYEGKLSSGSEAAENLNEIKLSMEKIGYRVVLTRGDVKR